MEKQYLLSLITCLLLNSVTFIILSALMNSPVTLDGLLISSFFVVVIHALLLNGKSDVA